MRIVYFKLSRWKQNLTIFFPLSILSILLSISIVKAPNIINVSSNRLHAIYKVQTTEKVVALTFDISWGTNIPEPVIDILKKNKIKSTFFLSGPWVRKYPEITHRLVKEGHEIASHGYRHIDLNRTDISTIKKEISQAHEILTEVSGRAPNLIRVPNGAYDEKVLNVANEMGYQVIQWSVDSLDWKNPGTEKIINRVLKKIHPGAIILMHASDTCQQTIDALPSIIEGLKMQGYQFITVSELLTYGPGIIH